MEPKQILILVLLLGIYIFNIVSKNKAKKRNAMKELEPEPSYEEMPDFPSIFEEKIPQKTPMENTPLAEILAKPAKSKVFKSYETLSDREFELLKKQAKNKQNEIQNINNELDDIGFLELDIEELRTGIIYSEILKRPNY